MRIGILTFYQQVNYGGVLQAFALQKFLHINHINSEVIRYWIIDKNSLLRIPFEVNIENRKLKFLRRAKYYLKHLIYNDIYIKDIWRRLRTKKFMKNMIHESCKEYKNATELMALNDDYDCIIVGSDQIWNPHFEHTRPYLLQYVSDKVRKIAYAASFGVNDIPNSKIELYKSALKRFDSISCREKSGVDLAERICNISTMWVVDPVLLLPHGIWKCLVGEEYDNGRYFCYWLGKITDLEQLLASIPNNIYVDLFAHDNLWFSLKRKYKNVHFHQDAGPLEFLTYLSRCHFMISDSYHAMLFSLIFHKHCRIYLEVNGDRTEMANRMVDFVQKMGLDGILTHNLTNINEVKIDFESFDRKIALWRFESAKYLMTSLV